VAFRKKIIDIGVVSPYDIRCKCDVKAWRFNHAIKCYSYPGEEGRKVTFYVYSNAPRVEFYQNNKLLKRAKIDPKKCFIKFNGKYIPGSIKAVAKDLKGNLLGETCLKTASENTKLRYYKEEYPEADRFAYVHFLFADEEGNANIHQEKNIEITDVRGGKLLRLGNSASYNKVGYLTNKIKTYHAKGMAIFEFDENSKEISFLVNSELGEEKITITR
jgi:beta-galactosidase